MFQVGWCPEVRLVGALKCLAFPGSKFQSHLGVPPAQLIRILCSYFLSAGEPGVHFAWRRRHATGMISVENLNLVTYVLFQLQLLSQADMFSVSMGKKGRSMPWRQEGEG